MIRTIMHVYEKVWYHDYKQYVNNDDEDNNEEQEDKDDNDKTKGDDDDNDFNYTDII